MATNPLTSATLAANPTLDAHPERYSTSDATSINRVVGQLRCFLPWVKMAGQFLEVRGHDSATPMGADFYDHASASSTPNALRGAASQPYVFKAAGSAPTVQIGMKEIASRFDSRNFTDNLLSHQFNQIAFQKKAMRHAIYSALELALITGTSAVGGQFDGLSRLAASMGLGQVVTAAVTDELNKIDEAITKLRSHNRKCDLLVMNQNSWRRVLELQRDKGFAPQFKFDARIGQRILHIDGIPVCLSDHIGDVAGSVTTSDIYFLCLGRPNGVYGLLSKRKPGVFYTKTSRDDSPFYSYEAHLYCSLVSSTTDALVKLTGWRNQLSVV